MSSSEGNRTFGILPIYTILLSVYSFIFYAASFFKNPDN